MEIHLHLSRQFRALDYKWGTPIDLDATAAFADITVRPDVQLDMPADTFSSERYLRAIRRPRPTPYSRGGSGRRMGKIKQVSKPYEAETPGPVAQNSSLQDSAVSLSESAASREEGLLTAMRGLVEDMEAPMEESYMFDERCLGEMEKMAEGKRQFESVFKQLKNAAFSYIKKRYSRMS